MIKIIKEGVIPKKYKRIYSATCPSCKCEFEFELDDCFNVEKERSISGSTIGEINCPTCCKTLTLNINACSSRQEEDNEDEEKITSIFDKLELYDLVRFKKDGIISDLKEVEGFNKIKSSINGFYTDPDLIYEVYKKDINNTYRRAFHRKDSYWVKD